MVPSRPCRIFFGAILTPHLRCASPVRTTHISSTVTDKIEEHPGSPLFRRLHVRRSLVAAHACSIGVRLYAGHRQSNLSPRALCTCPFSATQRNTFRADALDGLGQEP